MTDRVGKAIERADAEKSGTLTLEDQIQKYEKWWQGVMPAGGEARQLVRDAVHCVRTTPDLALCDTASILGGLMTCAQLGLRPGVANLGHAWLVPLKDKKGNRYAALWLGYRGFIELAYRNPRIEVITGRAVRAGELFKASYEPPALLHEPVKWGEDPGPVVGYYGSARMARGGLVFNLLDEQEAEQIRQARISGGRPSQVWRDHPEPMKIKTAIRRMWRWLPSSLEMQAVDAIDGAVRLDPDPGRRPEDASQIIDAEAVDDDRSGSDDPADGPATG